MRSKQDRIRARGRIVSAMVAAVVAVSVGSAVAQSPAPSSFDDLDPDAIVLLGRIVGSNTGVWAELPPTDLATQVTMDVRMTLTPDRAVIEGTAMVSGSYTGDCQFAHEESVAILSDSNDPSLRPPTDPAAARPAFASVGVYTTDPRFAERPLEGFYLSAAAATSESGGTCGYLTGGTYPIEDVGGALSIEVMSCSEWNIIGGWDGYTGSCTDTTSGDRVTIDWTASFEQLFP